MQQRNRGARWLWIVALLGAIGIGAFMRFRPPVPSGAAVPEEVQVAGVEQGTLKRRITATGVVAAQTGALVKIGSQITGRIRNLPADVGSRVRAGQVVAVLDSPDLEAQVRQQQHNVGAARASLTQAQARLRQRLANAGFTRDQTEAQIREASAALDASQSKVDAAGATALLQPQQTRAEINRAAATLSSAQATLRQAEQTARQQIQQAQSSIDEAQASNENARKTLTRYESLLREGFAAAQDVDNYRSSSDQAAARLDSARANLDVVREKTRTDVDTAREQVRQAQASLEAAKAGTLQDTVREADLRAARQSVEQSRATLELRQASHAEERIRTMEVEEAKGAVAQARASLQQAEAQLQYQQAQLDKAIIHSPIRGTVLSIAAQQGETIAAGLAAPTLITVADLQRLEVRAYVDETDIGQVRLGLPAEIRVESYPDRVFRGRVSKIASASTVKDNVVTYETTIAVQDAGGLLRPDMTADVGIVLGERTGVLLVPSEAVHRDGNTSLVYVLHRDRAQPGNVEKRTVEAGSDDGERTEIRSGVKPGEELVLAGLARLGVRASDAVSGGPGR
jgi:RND family efflux transporter MFP subunit